MVAALSLGFLPWAFACSPAPPQHDTKATAPSALDAQLAEQGRKLFVRKGCDLCHRVDGSPGTGPGLAGIGKTIDRKKLMDWCMDPEVIYRREGRRPLRPGYAPMPPQEVTSDEARAIAEYLLGLTPPSGR